MKMKKFVMAVVLIVAVVSGVFAQAGKTNAYKVIETIRNNDGVRSKENRNAFYITFTNNSCFASDVNGNRKRYDDGDLADIHTYQGEQNNTHVYVFLSKPSGYGTQMVKILLFSKDYKRFDEYMVDKSDPNYVYGGYGIGVQLEPVTGNAVISTTNLALLPRPSSVAQSSPSYPVPVNPTPNYPSPSNGGGSTVGNRLQCKNCNGTGRHPRCDGTGRIQCTICYGRDKNCFTCKGTGTTPCPELGYNCQAGRCLQCRGTGWINL
jgi:hypothetical protein